MTNTEQQFAEDELEISLNDIIGFFWTNWKFLLMGTILGFIIAMSGTLLLGKYKAETTLVTRSSMSFLTWKNLRRNLPILAAQISESANGSESGSENFLDKLSDETWWQENVTPTFAIAKEDSKEIFGMPKELQDAQSTVIKDFVFQAKGWGKEKAIQNLSIAASFFRSGAAYLTLNNLIVNYKISLLSTAPDIARSITESEIELAYLNGRVTNLELLRTKFPGNAGSIINQPVDPKDSGAKYLPIVTQLIAANRDIDTLKEKLSRLNNSKNKLAILESFLLQAEPVVVPSKNFDGLSVVAKLMQIEASLRKNLQPADLNKINKLDEIKSELVSIHTNFSFGLGQPMIIGTKKPAYLTNAAIGLLSGFFLALLGSFGSAIWLRYRKQTQ